MWSLNHLQRPHINSASFTLKYERLRSVLWLQQGVETAASGLLCSQAPLGGLSLLFSVRGGPSPRPPPGICPSQTQEDLQGHLPSFHPGWLRGLLPWCLMKAHPSFVRCSWSNPEATPEIRNLPRFLCNFTSFMSLTVSSSTSDFVFLMVYLDIQGPTMVSHTEPL